MVTPTEKNWGRMMENLRVKNSDLWKVCLWVTYLAWKLLGNH